jgi:adenylate cyclase
MHDRVRINVLGRFEILSGGEPVDLRARKAQALLVILAVEQGTPQSRERLATLLWGSTDDENARHNVRQALSHIRKDCGPIVVSRGEALTIDRDICSTDVADFLSSVEGQDAKALTTALDHVRGDLLEGVHIRAPDFENWLRDARERFHTLACNAIDRLAEILIAEDRAEEAEAAFRRRLEMDPVCENAHRGLMTLFARTGRRSDALRQYRLCADALKRELDVDPGPDTRAVFDALTRSGEPSATDTEPGSGHAMLTASGPVVAVLPFDNLAAEDDIYFADGITEDLITALSRFNDLQVIARTSSFLYRGREVPDVEIASALGAAYLVRGSVRRHGGKARITAQLLEGASGRALWAEQYDRELADVFEVQNEITATLVSTLVGRVESDRLLQVRSMPVERLEAYDVLLRGKYHHHLFTADDCRKCIELFDMAINRDPDYAVAYAWRSCGLGQAMVHNLDDHAKLLDRSKASAERGLELDENESECHRVLAQVQLTRGNLKRSLWHQERALFLNPNDDRSICAMGEILTFTGRAPEGEKWVQKSLRLNPYHPQRYWSHLARSLLHQGRFREALDVLDRIGRQRMDDLAYAVTASVMLGESQLIERSVAALRIALPDFDTDAFMNTQPYERAEDRDLIRSALESAL